MTRQRRVHETITIKVLSTTPLNLQRVQVQWTAVATIGLGQGQQQVLQGSPNTWKCQHWVSAPFFTCRWQVTFARSRSSFRHCLSSNKNPYASRTMAV